MTEALITDQAVLDELVQAIGREAVLGLDTEFVRVSTFHPKPGLIQIAVDGDAHLIDPLAGLDLAGFGQALASGPVSVLHAAQEDYEVLFSLTGALPGPVFDTQVAHALVAPQLSLSLSALVEQITGEVLSKEETRSDWTVRPLSGSQCEYARQDVLVLRPLYDALYAQLASLGRLAWMDEEMTTILDKNRRVMVDGDIETQVHKFGNAWRLSGDGMSRLVHLVQWREEKARTLDRPRKHILSDQSVFSLAASGPALRHHQLVSQHGLTDKQADRFGHALNALLEEAVEAGPMDPPPPPLSKRQKDQLRELQAACEAVASRLGMAPEMLVKKRQLVAAIDGRQWRPTGWRAEVLEGVF